VGVPVIGIVRQRVGMDGELPLSVVATLILNAELVRFVRLGIRPSGACGL